jgi:hypothetical protein
MRAKHAVAANHAGWFSNVKNQMQKRGQIFQLSGRNGKISKQLSPTLTPLFVDRIFVRSHAAGRSKFITVSRVAN